MTGPEGEKYHGWWRVTSVNPPKSLEFADGFADQDGNSGRRHANNHGVHAAHRAWRWHPDGTAHGVRLPRRDGASSTSMGMTEGMREAVGQMDALLAG